MTRKRNASLNEALANLVPTSDLPPQKVVVLVTVLNRLVASLIAVSLGARSFSWNVPGPYAVGYGSMFGSQADCLLKHACEVAERVRKLGGRTLTGIQEIVALQTAEDDDSEIVEAMDMVRDLLGDCQELVKQLRAAADLCESSGDCASYYVLSCILDKVEGYVWELYVTQDDPNEPVKPGSDGPSYSSDAPNAPGYRSPDYV